MPDRAMESRHLAEAVRHIGQAEQAIARIEALIARGHALGSPTGEAESSLAVMRSVLATFNSHRKLIEQTIDEIDTGRFG